MAKSLSHGEPAKHRLMPIGERRFSSEKVRGKKKNTHTHISPFASSSGALKFCQERPVPLSFSCQGAVPYELCGLIAASIHGLQRLEPSAVGFTHRKSSCLLRWGQYNKQRFCWYSGPSAIATYMPGFLLSLLQCNFLSFCHTLSCSTDSNFLDTVSGLCFLRWGK